MSGLIPARAGNTQKTHPVRVGLGAHPRSRGEHCSEGRSVREVSGSSPLARGTLGIRKWIKAPRGLIPARAGNTVNWRLIMAGKRAHPRSRGEHMAAPSLFPQPTGSSPLARGTPVSPEPVEKPLRLIPARAGNTHCCASQPSPPLNALAGSSPLARGTPRRSPDVQCVAGLIPARAGNTVRPPRLLRTWWAHPRSRGEHRVREVSL